MRVARNIGGQEIFAIERPGKEILDEHPGLGNREVPVDLIEGVMEEARKRLHILAGIRQAVIEALLGRLTDDKIGSRREDQHRKGDGAGVVDETPARIVETEQDVHGDVSRDQGILVIGSLPVGIVREKLAFDIARDEELAAQLFEQAQPLHGKGNVEAHIQRRTPENQSADPRRVIMSPGRDENTGDAVRHDDDVLLGNAIGFGYMPHEAVDVLDERRDVFGIAALAGRAAVTSGIPGEKRISRQIELVDNVLPAGGMLMTAMEQDDGLAGSFFGLPGTVEKLRSVPAGHRVFCRAQHSVSPEES